MIMAFWIFSCLIMIVIVINLRKILGSINAYPVFSPIKISIGENYPLLFIKSVLFVMILFIIMNFELFDPLIYFYVIIATLFFFLLYVSGYRYR